MATIQILYYHDNVSSSQWILRLLSGTLQASYRNTFSIRGYSILLALANFYKKDFESTINVLMILH